MRKKFLIKPTLQIRHLLWTLGVVTLSCLLGYILFESMLSAALARIGTHQSMFDQLIISSRWGFVLILVILLSAIGVENYLLFHKFIGPLYALEKGLKKMAEGDLTSTTHIRESDQLSDLVNAFEDMRKEIQARLITQENLNRLLNSSALNTDIHELKNQLEQIRKHVEKKAA